MPLSTDLAVDRENSKLEVKPFLRKEANACLARLAITLQYGKTAMGADTF